MIQELKLRQVIGVCTKDKGIASNIMDEIANMIGTSYTKSTTQNSLTLKVGNLLDVIWIPSTFNSRGVRLTKVIVDDSVDEEVLQTVILPLTCQSIKNVIRINAEDYKDDGLPF